MTPRDPGKVPLIATGIRRKIKEGEPGYTPGSLLPSAPDLQREHKIAYQTAQNVYGVLEEEGLVFSRKGKGTFVSLLLGKILREGTKRYQPANRAEAGAHGAFEAEIRRLGLVFTPAPTNIARERPPKRVGELLAVHHAAKALKRERVMQVALPDNDDVSEVVQLATSWFPKDVADRCPALGQQNTGPGGSKNRLKDAGFKQVSIREEIEVRAPSPEEAYLLGMPSGRAVMEITHCGRTADGRIVEVAQHVVPRTKWRLAYEWPIGD